MQEITKPVNKSNFRRKLGKEYFILKRKYNWYFSNKKWATVNKKHTFPFSVFKHKSFVLRPLKNVEMYLQHNKRKNLALAISKINAVTINPGETFSIWKLVGRPTANKGYLEGLSLKQGQIGKDVGGGLCQLGNLLFWIFAHSPLTIKERYRHGFDVFPDINRKVPFGAGATLAYNYIDLQVKNETKSSFQIKLWLDDAYLNGELRATEKMNDTFRIEERNHIIKQQFWGAYSRHNQIYQIKTNQFKKETEKLLVENHAIMMYNPLLEKGN